MDAAVWTWGNGIVAAICFVTCIGFLFITLDELHFKSDDPRRITRRRG
jgi:hypothetical protein